jgi:alpha-D-xyloside xylohydrolase
LKNLLDMGVACIKTDFGEDIHMDAEYEGMEPEKLRNLYALLYQKAAFEITREITGENIIWARAGWAGCQRYPVHWGGDAASTWDGMAGSLKGGLHMGLSGFGFWSHDVPGFHGLPDFMNAVIPDDLYVRWTQFGVFTSHLRYHGTSKREPWHFPEVSGIVKKWLRLRYALLPYLIKQSEKVISTGFPIIRALVFHHPGDKLCWHIYDQYYFGDDFLVAPVMNPWNQRDIYLPQGDWINLFSGKMFEGGQWLNNLEIPLEEMPVFMREGARIPVYPEKILTTDEYDPGKVEYLVADEKYRGMARSCLGELWEESR